MVLMGVVVMVKVMVVRSKETRRRPPRGVHVRDTSVSWHFPLAASHLAARLPTPD